MFSLIKQPHTHTRTHARMHARAHTLNIYTHTECIVTLDHDALVTELLNQSKYVVRMSDEVSVFDGFMLFE